MYMERIFWADLEMTGLDPEQSVIIEFAAIVTDLNFKELGSYHSVVYQPPSLLEGMDEWNTRTHTESGLLAGIPNGKKLELVESELLAFIDEHFKEENPVLAGNSIHQDRKFIDRYMPRLSKRLHYRLLDVSSFKLIYNHLYQVRFTKQNTHRAVDDIHESINELKHYLGYVKVSL